MDNILEYCNDIISAKRVYIEEGKKFFKPYSIERPFRDLNYNLRGRLIATAEMNIINAKSEYFWSLRNVCKEINYYRIGVCYKFPDNSFIGYCFTKGFFIYVSSNTENKSVYDMRIDDITVKNLIKEVEGLR